MYTPNVSLPKKQKYIHTLNRGQLPTGPAQTHSPPAGRSRLSPTGRARSSTGAWRRTAAGCRASSAAASARCSTAAGARIRRRRASSAAGSTARRRRRHRPAWTSGGTRSRRTPTRKQLAPWTRLRRPRRRTDNNNSCNRRAEQRTLGREVEIALCGEPGNGASVIIGSPARSDGFGPTYDRDGSLLKSRHWQREMTVLPLIMLQFPNIKNTSTDLSLTLCCLKNNSASALSAAGH